MEFTTKIAADCGISDVETKTEDSYRVTAAAAAVGSFAVWHSDWDAVSDGVRVLLSCCTYSSSNSCSDKTENGRALIEVAADDNEANPKKWVCVRPKRAGKMCVHFPLSPSSPISLSLSLSSILPSSVWAHFEYLLGKYFSWWLEDTFVMPHCFRPSLTLNSTSLYVSVCVYRCACVHMSLSLHQLPLSISGFRRSLARFT